MKIALLFSGQPRYIRECYPSIKENLLDKYNCDIYSHLWWDDAYIGKKFKFHASDQYTENMKDVFLDLYQPKEFVFEAQKHFDSAIYPTDTGEMAQDLGNIPTRKLWCREVIFKQKSMWYSALQAYNLYYKHRYDYDMVIRLRTDLLLTKEIDGDKIKPDFLYIDEFENQQQLCDWFAISKSPEKIGQYHQVYNNIHPWSLNGILRSTTILRRTLEIHHTPLKIKDLGVRIFRGYKEPRKMDEYSETNTELHPYWYVSKELR